MLSVVVDTNVLVSAILSPQGPPARVLQMTAEGSLQLAVSPAIMAEYQLVLGRKRLGISPETAEQIIVGLRLTAVEVVPTASLRVSPDPADDKFLECALAAGASHLITGNLRHFPKTFRSIRIIAPAEFLRASGL